MNLSNKDLGFEEAKSKMTTEPEPEPDEVRFVPQRPNDRRERTRSTLHPVPPRTEGMGKPSRPKHQGGMDPTHLRHNERQDGRRGQA